MRTERHASERSRQRLVSHAAAILSILCLGTGIVTSASAATVDRIKETGRIRFGYFVDARPFSYRSEDGRPQGYSIALCEQIAARAKTKLNLPQLAVDWVEVKGSDVLHEIAQSDIQVLCVPASATLERRAEVSFSIPIFASGSRAILRADAPAALREALGDNPTMRPVWRGQPASKVLSQTRFAVVAGTTSEDWIKERRADLKVDAKIATVRDYRTALQQLLDRNIDVFFGDRSAALSTLATMSGDARQKVRILDHLFTHEPVALALPRNDDDFRLLVDGALTELYLSPQFSDLYTKWFGEFDDRTRLFYVWVTPGT